MVAVAAVAVAVAVAAMAGVGAAIQGALPSLDQAALGAATGHPARSLVWQPQAPVRPAAQARQTGTTVR